MSQKVSRNLLIAEAIIIALPISIFAIIATVFFVNSTRRVIGFALHEWLAVFSVLCLSAIFSGWRLFVAYLYGGLPTLRSQNFGWWAMIVVGILILIASLISRFLPPSPEYSAWDYFRSDLNLFTLALPILVPIGHIAYEQFIRKQTS